MLRRPEARFGPSLAAAGTVLVAIGLGVLAVGYFAHGFGIGLSDSGARPSVHGEARRWLGAGLFLALTAAGYAVLVLRRHGPLATAGTVAAVIAVPITLLFATVDVSGTVTGGQPVNTDVLFLLSILIYLVSYVFVPGARGRPVFLALAASDLYTYIALKSATSSLVRLGASIGGVTGATTPDLSAGDGPKTVAVLGLVFGLGYYAVAAALDRSGRHGAAVALVYAGFGATVAGLAAGVVTFGQVGTGVAFILVGGVLALYGGSAGRRFTTWTWTGVVALGVLVLVAKFGTDNYVGAGITLAVVGAVGVAIAHVFTVATRERPDLDESAAVRSQ